MKKLFILSLSLLMVGFSLAQTLEIKSATNPATGKKTKAITSIDVDEDSGFITVHGAKYGRYKIKGINYGTTELKRPLSSDNNDYSGESQTEVVSLNFKNGEGIFRNSTTGETIQFTYK